MEMDKAELTAILTAGIYIIKIKIMFCTVAYFKDIIFSHLYMYPTESPAAIHKHIL